MSIIDTLITDRTQSDVDARNDKGTYNATDLNRVGAACEYVSERLNTIGGFDLHPVAKQDWKADDIPTAEQMNAYIADIKSIRTAYKMLAPKAPESANNLTYEEANDIEEILIVANNTLDRVMKSFVYSGRLFAGQIWEGFE